MVCTPALARNAVPLTPFDWGGGFSRFGPAAVPTEHPLYGRIAVAPIIDMPNRVGSTFVLVTRPNEFNAALEQTLASAHMLAPDKTTEKAILTVQWVSFDLPFKISQSSEVTAILRYKLTRADNGKVIFQRDITTSASGSGGNATDRTRGIGRAALMANIAGATWCLQKAATGPAPADCSTKALGGFSAPIVVYSPAIH